MNNSPVVVGAHQLDELHAHIDTLKELLRKLEWTGPVCPICYGDKPNHEPDCELAKAIHQ